MKKNILPIFLCLLTLSCFGQYSGQYEVAGGKGNPYPAKDDSGNDIQVYLMNGLDNAKITFISTSSGTHQWYKYSEKANDGIAIPCQQAGNISYITDISDGMGYYVGNPANMSTSYVWIIDYSRKVPVFNSLNIQESDDKCEMIELLIDINADKLQYYTPKGILSEVVRNYILDYYTMKWSDENRMFMSLLKEEKISGNDLKYPIDINPAPLQNTKFTLSGDQFAEYFNIRQVIETEEYEAIAVLAEIITDSISNTSGNQMTGEDGSISAPVDFTFTAYANEPVATFYTWKIYNLSRSETEPVSQTTNKILYYSFEDAGHYKVELEVSDYRSICTYKTSPGDIIVSDFMLWIPNAFSPATSPGVNDIFRVAYKSVVKFNGWIYNRWGNEIFHWSDPSQGWDGKYRGKYVPPGVYFYVIEATSANGKKHIRKGDVNIVGGK